MMSEDDMITQLDELRRDVYLKGIDSILYPFFQEQVHVVLLSESPNGKK